MRDFIKSLDCKIHQNVKPFYIFITGGARVGKSHLIKTIYLLLSKVLIYTDGELEKLRILLLTPTWVAATNINGIIIPSGLGINVGCKLYPLREQHRAVLRNKLSEDKIIDKILMLSNVLFFKLIRD